MMAFLLLFASLLVGACIEVALMMTLLYWTGMLAEPFGLAPEWWQRKHPPFTKTTAANTIYIFECHQPGNSID